MAVLNAIWEPDFLGLSYGFRPGRGQHDALDALAAGIDQRKVNWILDADVKVWTLSDGQVSVVVGVRRIFTVVCHAVCSNFSFASGNVSANVCIGVLP